MGGADSVDVTIAMDTRDGPQRAVLGDYVALMRPTQWVKNIIVFAAPAAALKLDTSSGWWRTVLTFVAFCFAASAVYAVNDAVDRHADAVHPHKRLRPVARGVISAGSAVMFAGMLFTAALAMTLFLINVGVTVVLALYVVLMLGYSMALKRLVILDVIVLAFGFVLRAWAGAEAVNVVVSEWLTACVFTLCLFFGFGKRRCEVATMARDGGAAQHRSTLVSYTPDLLNHLITVSAGIAVMTFLLYTMDTVHHPAPFPKQQLFYTLPLVVYGVFRFAMLTELGIHVGPTEILIKDRGMLAAIILWIVVALGIAYRARLAGLMPG